MGTIRLGPDRAPERYDVTFTGDSPDGGKTYHGIYKVEGDTLTTCVNINPGKERPADFTTRPESGHQLVVWKRVKAGINQAGESAAPKSLDEGMARLEQVLGRYGPDEQMEWRFLNDRERKLRRTPEEPEILIVTKGVNVVGHPSRVGRGGQALSRDCLLGTWRGRRPCVDFWFHRGGGTKWGLKSSCAVPCGRRAGSRP